MKKFLAEFWLAVRYSPRLYFAPFVGAIRGAQREVARVQRQMTEEGRRMRERR